MKCAALISAGLMLWSGPNQDEPLRLRSDLVLVPVSVLDSSGRSIRSLKAADFAIYEDGVKQAISHFESGEAPFLLILLLDISGSTSQDMELIKRAAKGFLAELGSRDKVAVIAFGKEVRMIANINSSVFQAEAAIEALQLPAPAGSHRFSSNTGTSFYDALYLAARKCAESRFEGRRAIVCLSDGVDSTSRLGYADAARAIEEADASVHFLALSTEQATLDGLLRDPDDPNYINFSRGQINRYYDEYDPDSPERFLSPREMPPWLRRKINAGLYQIARRQMQNLAERTGGQVYEARSLSDLLGLSRQIAEELRAQYLIGYYPSREARDGRWHAIRVEVNREGARIRARSGYWSLQ
jgi:VWFA-related protein